jgi:hypothetical protein
MYSRRNFLKIGGLFMAGGMTLGGNIFGQSAVQNDYFPIPTTVFSDRITSFTQQTFEPLLNTSFMVVREDSVAVSMRLVEIVSDDNKKKFLNRVANDNFSLIFEVVGRDILEDKIYEISHAELGGFSIFISTVGRSGNRYQAVFSRVYF